MRQILNIPYYNNERIDEFTQGEIIDASDLAFLKLGDRYKVLDDPQLLGIKGRTASFQTKSAVKDQYYKQMILFKDINILMRDKNIDIEEAIQLVMYEDDISVSCQCPAYLYWGFKYQATQLDYNRGRGEDRFPKIRNPFLKNTVCKHLYSLLTKFEEYEEEIIYHFKHTYKNRGYR